MTRGLRLTSVVLLAVAFLGSCIAMIPASFHLLEPMTHMPVDQIHSPFPILVVSGSQASILMTDTPYEVPPPPSGASYLVPLDRVKEIERYIRQHEIVRGEGGWVLRVKQIAADRQRIELFIMGDGMSGGVYDASSSSVTPQYRKITGPGLGIIGAPLSLGLNVALWSAGALSIWVYRRYRGAAQPPLAGDSERGRTQ